MKVYVDPASAVNVATAVGLVTPLTCMRLRIADYIYFLLRVAFPLDFPFFLVLDFLVVTLAII